ncbi:MAG: hypothetical protein JXM70_22220 [Pirellulales bacterium]|nr:hypothetical protein [Pirellulales bacterium]
MIISFWIALPLQAQQLAGTSTDLKPGVLYIFFDDCGFNRPGNHEKETGIKSHGEVVEIKSTGIDAQLNLDIEGINGYSQVWVGKIRFPQSGEVTFSAEVDTGMRLFIDGKCIMNASSPDSPREGKLQVKAGELLPLRVEYVQNGGPSYLRLYWKLPGHKRELVPPSAFWHSSKDLDLLKAAVAGKKRIVPGGITVVSVPSGDEAMHSSIYRPGTGADKRSNKPITLGTGPHLFIDDYLIAQSKNVKRRVNCPTRDTSIPNPLVTGKEDECVAPYTTIIRDPKTGHFRLWYNIYKKKFKDGLAYFATMESNDGIHWIRPRKVLNEPSNVNFGCSVLDEGSEFTDHSKRYKIAWWHDGGLRLGVSPDGLNWKMFLPYSTLRHNHDINNIFRDTLRDCYVATISVHTTGPNWKGLRRCTMQTRSKDFIHWEKPWYILTPDDNIEPGETQFYAMQGHLIRGGLWIGLVKVLHDDWKAPGTPEGAFGVGYTTLAWTRDGTHWFRDLEPFFEPDPKVDAWDHAHAWMDYQLPVGDEVWIYYGGYKYGHKMDRWEGRQLGLVKMPRDRYVSRDAGDKEGSLRTPPVILAGKSLTVNADVQGELRARILDTSGKPLKGFDLADCRLVKGDALNHRIRWKGSLDTINNRPVQIEFVMNNARLYGFDLEP